MSLKGWFKGGTPLQLAIERGLKPGGDLVAELDELDDYTIKTKRDAQAICRALEAVDQNLGAKVKHGKSPLYKLAGLFQDTEGGSDACEYLREHGIPLLIKLARKARTEVGFNESNFLFVLKMLAAYGTTEGADLIIEVARNGYARSEYMWSVVLGVFSHEHPEARRVLTILSDPLPDEFIAVSLLDAANHFWIDGGEMHHPFDSDSGVEKLKALLCEPDPELFSYSYSATVALPFIQHARQDELFQIAYNHPSVKVRLEAAWAEGKLDHARGLERLVGMCRDINYSARARLYLKELHREGLIPPETQRPDFVAKASFSEWLSHPNELGRAPDELEIVDHRDLCWPTDHENKHFWLIKYRAKDETGLAADDIGVGLVGSKTFCLFSYELHQRPPEDVYAIHCYWEMTHSDLITDSDAEESSDYESLLQQWSGPLLEETKMVAVSELEPEVSYPRRLIGLAAAKLHGKSGWIVLDGPESRWYARDEMPEVAYPKTILMMHIGRRLLGFKEEPDRKSFIKKTEKVPAIQIEAAYERLICAAENGTEAERKRLLKRRGRIDKHFTDYVAAKYELCDGSKAQHLASTYERLLRLARQTQGATDSLLGLRAAVSNLFEEYVDALVELRRHEEIIPLVELFASEWPSERAPGRLGNAAFKAGRDEPALRFYLQLKETDEDWQRADEMACLATILHRRGNVEGARSLLLECMSKMVEDGRKAEGTDRSFFERLFQNHRQAFLKLFPDESLKQHNLPETTLR